MAILKSVRAACPCASRRMLSGLISLLGVRPCGDRNQRHIPVHDPHAVKINQTTSQLRNPKANHVLRKIAPSVEMVYHGSVSLIGGVKEIAHTSKIAT